MNSKESNSGINCSQLFDVNNSSSSLDDKKVCARPETVAVDDHHIAVRDMINIYNYATQKNKELAQAKSIYFGANVKEAEQQSEDTITDIQSGNFLLSTSNGQTSMQQKPSTIHSDAGTEAIEKSYQSKTTIRRTEQGVRIIIDIFFDKEEPEMDLKSSRVETDIPESRILADFQQHSLAMRSQKIKARSKTC